MCEDLEFINRIFIKTLSYELYLCKDPENHEELSKARVALLKKSDQAKPTFIPVQS